MSALDSDNLISQALKRLGNETITTDAQIWIFNVLDRLYEDFRWPFLEATATGTLTVGQSSVTLPTDFDAPWDVNSFVLINSEGSHHSLGFHTAFDQDELIDPSLEGKPDSALINSATMTWRPYPLPSEIYTWQVRYKSKPTRPGSYATFTPTFPNDEIIIQAIYVRGLQHEDDDRYVTENNELTRMIAVYKRKFNLQPQKGQRLRLSSKFSNPTTFR